MQARRWSYRTDAHPDARVHEYEVLTPSCYAMLDIVTWLQVQGESRRGLEIKPADSPFDQEGRHDHDSR